jgi:ABC-type multidrug transport system permease subunit
MLEFEGLSTGAKIGKILILIGIVLGIVSAIIIFTISSFGFVFGQFSKLFGVFTVLLGLTKTVGVTVGIYAYKSASNKEFHNAGILAIVSSLLPPLDLIMLIGGILCLVSKEAGK